MLTILVSGDVSRYTMVQTISIFSTVNESVIRIHLMYSYACSIGSSICSAITKPDKESCSAAVVTTQFALLTCKPLHIFKLAASFESASLVMKDNHLKKPFDE